SPTCSPSWRRIGRWWWRPGRTAAPRYPAGRGSTCARDLGDLDELADVTGPMREDTVAEETVADETADQPTADLRGLRVAVTGASGFCGSVVARAAAERGADVVCLGRRPGPVGRHVPWDAAAETPRLPD